MIKGAQKQMVVVKINDSDVFEEAYFVLRRGAGAVRMDMISEANRIVESSGVSRKQKKSVNVRAVIVSVVSFVAGSVIGAFLVGFVGMMS